MVRDGTRAHASTPSRGGGAERECRGIRGATALEPGIDERRAEAMVSELLSKMLADNGVDTPDVAAVIFTVQDDLLQLNPAAAARRQGFELVPLMAVREHAGAELVPRCLRVLILANSSRPQAEVHHVYLGAAARLRPDLTRPGGSPQ